MLRKIIEKLQFGSCKTKVTDNINTAKKSEEKKPEEKAK
jgi:hypothetical protein